MVSTPYTYLTLLDDTSPEFARPFDGAPPTSHSGIAAFRYGTLSFTPSLSGDYTLETVLSRLPTSLTLYQGSFDPLNPLTNALHTVSAGGRTQAALTHSLIGGMPYILVTTHLDTGGVGGVTNQISGPTGATLSLGATAPEPTSLILLALGGGGLLRRKKRL